MRPFLHGSLVLAILLAAVAPGRAQDDKIFKTMTPDQIEAFLAKMEIEFQRRPSRRQPGTFMYDFKRKS